MQGKENISEELRQVSGLVADISRKELFEVPTGYFEGFAGKVLELVRAGEAVELSPALSGVRRLSVYTAPAGYFEDFAGKMLAHIHATEELAGISSLLSGIGKKTPFSTPEGYFDRAPGFLSQITGSPMNTGSSAGMVNENAVVDPVTLSPLLAGLKEKAVYQVPEGYFAGLADSILVKAGKQSGQARVVSIGLGRKWLKYAAAAIVAGMLVTGGWLGFHKSADPEATGDLATVLSKDLSKVSDQEIQNYLDNQDVLLADAVTNNSTATVDITDSDAKTLLGDVPDEELKTYAEEHGAIKDLVTN
jgi:hypothetical protein